MKLHHACFLAATMLAAAPALADEPTVTEKPEPAATPVIDAVHLRNGGLYRGHVTEIVPGDHVTILVEKGEPKRIAWAEIDRVVVATTPVPPPPSGDQVGARTIPSATTPTPAPMNGPKARVHIASSTTAVLYRRASGSTAWTLACTSPCDELLPLGDSYRVTGNGIAQSDEFTLRGSPGSTIEIKVDGPSTAGIVLGGTLATVGFLAGYVGLLVVAASLDRYGADDDARAGGLVAMGLGGLATVGGLLIFFASAKTDVTQNPTSGGGKDAWRRLPTWRTAERGAAPAQFPVLFSHAF